MRHPSFQQYRIEVSYPLATLPGLNQFAVAVDVFGSKGDRRVCSMLFGDRATAAAWFAEAAGLIDLGLGGLASLD